jgi:dTDP-glucose 4,6-dehydratase
MRRLLVTGGAGFIGANFIHYWASRYPEDRLVVLDALTYAGNVASIESLMSAGKMRFVHGDIRDTRLVESLLREEALDTVVHFAAESHVDRSIHGPDVFLSTNVRGTMSLLEACRSVWLANADVPHRFHHVSTDEVFGSLSEDEPAFVETRPYAPNSPYAASKAASDHLVRAWHHTYGLQVTTSNCSNNFGPFHFPEKLIPLMILNILKGKVLPVYGDGRNIRDWLYVEDHCAGVDRVLSRGAVGETYNIGGGCERRNIEIVEALCDRVDEAFAVDPDLARRFPDAPPAKGQDSRSLIAFVKDRPGHDWRYAIDAGKAARELGYAPSIGFDEGLRRTVAWYLANEAWWAGVLDGSYQDWIRQNYGEAGDRA